MGLLSHSFNQRFESFVIRILQFILMWFTVSCCWRPYERFKFWSTFSCKVQIYSANNLYLIALIQLGINIVTGNDMYINSCWCYKHFVYLWIFLNKISLVTKNLLRFYSGFRISLKTDYVSQREAIKRVQRQ